MRATQLLEIIYNPPVFRPPWINVVCMCSARVCHIIRYIHNKILQYCKFFSCKKCNALCNDIVLGMISPLSMTLGKYLVTDLALSGTVGVLCNKIAQN